jgi:hypothetical protein
MSLERNFKETSNQDFFIFPLSLKFGEKRHFKKVIFFESFSFLYPDIPQILTSFGIAPSLGPERVWVLLGAINLLRNCY